MKTRSLFIIGGALLAFASCTQEGTTGGFTQEQVDSIVNARVTEQMTALQASNDSTINAMAQWKADSIVAAMKGGNVTTVSKTTTTTTKNTTVKNPSTSTKEQPARGGLQSKSDQAKSDTRGGLQSKSDQTKAEEKSDGTRRGGLQSKSDQSKQQ
ncbi:MAG TPA: hypothetical protein VL098_07595 [Flavipsychrobacter sp.]|nr:hypothetical protein [Flavipsychrobacter sp.]